MPESRLIKKILRKQKELGALAARTSFYLTQGKVYEKSCELDRLIVEFMNKPKQLEFDFPDHPNPRQLF